MRLAWHAQCAMCPSNVDYPEGQLQLDHIVPCVGKNGWTTFDDFIDKLFCEADNFQMLCETHHDQKSLEEGQVRKKKRKKIK